MKLLDIFQHPVETRSLIKLYSEYQKYRPPKEPLIELSQQLDDIAFCYAALSKVSRSFAVVIQKLPDEVKDAVCVFYLVLRGLDTIEDDTTVNRDKRTELLLNFHRFLEDPEWRIDHIGDQEDYQVLLKEFPKVIAVYRQLSVEHQQVIAAICKEMGEGMAAYLDKELQSVGSYDKYCYYVAGVVGVGLTRLFVLSGLERPELTENLDLAVAMGLFLQKTNIIRDIKEDIEADRTFWPKEIWGIYVSNVEDLFQSPKRVACLNHMISDALQHATRSLEYLKMIQNPMVFQFCAIPQVMAIATLVELFHNQEVFNRNIKIRRGRAAQLMFKGNDFAQVHSIFKDCARQMFDQLHLDDPTVELQVRYLKRLISEESAYQGMSASVTEFAAPISK